MSKRESTAVARIEPAEAQPLSLFERLAKDRTINVDKLARLIDLQKDLMAMQARTAFNQAFATLQAALPVVQKNGVIKNRAGAVQSRYAKLDAIQDVVKPILQQHGFSLRHRTEWPREGIIRVVGILAHVQGHSEESAFEGPMDKSEYRSQVQSMGSTVSYGRRYTTIDLLNLTQRGQDDDGKGPREVPKKTRTVPPAGDDGNGDKPISDQQRSRLWTIALKKAHRTEAELAVWLQARYGVTESKAIKQRDYDAIIAAIEAPGPLALAEEAYPFGVDGEDE